MTHMRPPSVVWLAALCFATWLDFTACTATVCAAKRVAKKPDYAALQPKLQFTLAQHTKPIRSVAFNPDDGSLTTAGEGGQVFVWDMVRGQLKFPLVQFPIGDHHVVTSVGFQGDIVFGSLCTTWGNGFGPNQMILLRETGGKVAQVNINSGAPRGPTCADISHNSRYLAFGGNDRILRVYDLQVVGAMVAAKPKRHQFPEVTPNAVPFSDQITAVAWHPREALLAVGCRDGSITLHEIGNGVQFKSKMPSHNRQVNGLNFSPDGETLLSCSEDGHVIVARVTSREEQRNIAVSEAGVNSIAIDSFGGLMATAGDDHVVRLWTFPTMKEQAKLESHTEPVMSVAFTPDGRTMASGGRDLRVHTWQLYPETKTARRRR